MHSYFWFRFQRWRRRLRRDFRLYVSWGRNYINRHIWGKWRQLGLSRRLITVWWGLAVIMAVGLWLQTNNIVKPFLHIAAAKDAVFSEGGIGAIKIINPVLPDSTTASDVNSLIFSGLTRYNDRGQLEPDLATGWQVSADGKSYTFRLRRGVKWHDGVPFTSHDVAFTLAAIQNPDSRSPLANSWQGINIDTPDDFTVVYHLPNAYPPFITSTTQGLIPAHLLESTDPAALRASDFNQKPIGTGPFKLKTFLSAGNQVELTANTQYYGGKPQIGEFDYHWYASAGEERAAYAKRQIMAFGSVLPGEIEAASKLPSLRLYDYSQPNQTLLILRNTQPALKLVAVRQAIALAIDRASIIKNSLDDVATPVAGPILPGQLGYKSKYQLPKFNLDQAGKTLDAAGWAVSGGIRQKDGQKLQFNLVARDASLDKNVAQQISSQLAKLGIKVTVQLADLTTLEQTYIRPRNYDMLLFGYNIGPDPDVYAYWDSSQASDPGINLAAYNSPVSDKALESGRVNQSAQVRAGKYMTFQQQWQADVPSVPLYSQEYTYAVSSKVIGVKSGRLVDPADRFYGIEKWAIAAEPVR